MHGQGATRLSLGVGGLQTTAKEQHYASSKCRKPNKHNAENPSGSDKFSMTKNCDATQHNRKAAKRKAPICDRAPSFGSFMTIE